jgi:hypothetical protein
MPTNPRESNPMTKMKTGFPCRQCFLLTPKDAPNPAYVGKCSAVPVREVRIVISGRQAGARMPKWLPNALAILENNDCLERVEA